MAGLLIIGSSQAGVQLAVSLRALGYEPRSRCWETRITARTSGRRSRRSSCRTRSRRSR
ncbi:hypothetical protein [Leucobacter soli]|uniref:hypothetical protein n=1 Tax=Leucobacter soli TaxID=2812850 RepID=UPI00360C0810